MHERVDVYLDESGDLGFSDRSSRYFVIVALASLDSKELARVLKRVRRRLYSRGTKIPEFKFSSSPEHARRLVLRGVAGTSARVAWGGIKKQNTSSELRSDKKELYLCVCSSVLSELMRRTHARWAHIVLDKWSSDRTLRRHFEDHLRDVMGRHHLGYFAPSVSVSHLDSANSAGIQVADIVAGAIFQSLEHSDTTYLDTISHNIVYGELYW